KAYYEKNKEKMLNQMREIRRKNPLATRARRLLGLMVNLGQIKPPETCSLCLIETKPDAHHFDYAKPLAVIWLCRSCHHYVHSGYQTIPQALIDNRQKIV